jgi:hypothetical protein
MRAVDSTRAVEQLNAVLELTPAGLTVHVSRPIGYCDHFGLRRIAENGARAERLVAALKASGGSLALSWLNLGEYATVNDREQRLQGPHGPVRVDADPPLPPVLGDGPVLLFNQRRVDPYS